MAAPLTLRQKRERLTRIFDYLHTSISRRKRYPSREEIERKFHTNLDVLGIFSIKKLYQLAKIPYHRDPNPFLKYRKEKQLTKILLKLFPKLGYTIEKVSIGPSKPRGADIILRNENNDFVPVEIKAYHKFVNLGFLSHRHEITQLRQHIRKLKAPYGYLITSTNKIISGKMPNGIKVLTGNDLQILLSKFNFRKEIRILRWVQNTFSSNETKERRVRIKDRILNYIKRKIKEEKYVSRREIEQKFKIQLGSYFLGTKDIYKILGIDSALISNFRMGRKFDKERFKKRILTFVKEENKKGHFPTYKEIQRKFSCLPKLYFPGGMREIAKLVGIKYNRKFANKTPEEKELIKQKIIKYTKKKFEKGHRPGYRDFRKDLLVGPLNYFNSIVEIYQKAGYNGPIKKTWKNSGKKVEIKIKN